MTSLYRLDAPASRIASALGANAGGDVWAGGAVSPGGYGPVVIRDKDRVRRMVPRQWGVPPPPRGQQIVTTVRNLTSPFWIGTLRHTQFRCLIPVTRFRLGSGNPGGTGENWLCVPSFPIFVFAGIWRDSDVPSFAVVTTQANTLIARGRFTAMPTILHPDDYDLWLTGNWKEAQRLVAPFPSQQLQAGPEQRA